MFEEGQTDDFFGKELLQRRDVEFMSESAMLKGTQGIKIPMGDHASTDLTKSQTDHQSIIVVVENENENSMHTEELN